MHSAHPEISRDSTEYVEVLAEIFGETVGKTATRAAFDGADPEITPSLMECLQYVFLHGPSPVREIACGLEVSVSAASQLVDRLVRKDLATRREDASDRRLTSVELTEAGRDIIRRIRERRSRWFESVMASMSEPELRAFRDGLEGFLQAALAEDGNIDRACVRCGLEHVSFCVVNRVRAGRGQLSRAETGHKRSVIQ